MCFVIACYLTSSAEMRYQNMGVQTRKPKLAEDKSSNTFGCVTLENRMKYRNVHRKTKLREILERKVLLAYTDL